MSPTKKIVKLSPEQDAMLPAIRDEWIAYGLSAAPADRRAAEAAMKLVYERGGVPWHGRVVWAQSPVSLALVDALTRDEGVRGSVGDSVWDSVRDSVWASVGDSVGASVGDSVRDSVRASVGDSVWASVWDSVWASVNSYYESSGLAFYDAFRQFGVEGCVRLDGIMALHQSAGWWIARKGIALIAERPNRVYRDDAGRLHADDGMAIQWPDQWGIYAWHGVRVPRQVIDAPETLTVQQITAESNAEVRRVMLERFGCDRYLREMGAEPISTEHVPCLNAEWCQHTTEQHQVKLYRAEIRDDEPLCMVEVVNSTPELDGTWKHYFLRVPPSMNSARQAVAWTCGFDRADEYQPQMQS